MEAPPNYTLPTHGLHSHGLTSALEPQVSVYDDIGVDAPASYGYVSHLVLMFLEILGAPASVAEISQCVGVSSSTTHKVLGLLTRGGILAVNDVGEYTFA